ncbi:hypothetical protein ACIOJE_35250, partial [Kitasatospora sp. NPDC087861]
QAEEETGRAETAEAAMASTHREITDARRQAEAEMAAAHGGRAAALQLAEQAQQDAQRIAAELETTRRELADARRQAEEETGRAETAEAAMASTHREITDARRQAEGQVGGVLRARLAQVEDQQGDPERGVEVTPAPAEPGTATETKAKKRTQPKRAPRARRR